MSSTRTRAGESSRNREKINIGEMCRERRKEDQQATPELDANCVSLEYRRRAPCAKPLSPGRREPRCPAQDPEIPCPPPPCSKEVNVAEKRGKKLARGAGKISHRSVECTTGPDVRAPCGVVLSDYAKNLESRENRGKGNAGLNAGKPCSSDKRRNMLKSKIRELLREVEPIPESCLLEITESKPEPEVLAEVLLMSESKATDLSDAMPDDIFLTLFSDVDADQSIAITNVAPESISDAVVPVRVPGREGPSVDMPHSENIIENVRGEAPPNMNAFQQSNVYEQFSEHVNELLERTPPSQNISELLGVSSLGGEINDTGKAEEGILDYLMKPGPPTRVNKIRLNGSIMPDWFPGYIVVSPLISGFVKITDDPGEALKEAWKLCHPRHFDDQSRTIVNVG